MVNLVFSDEQIQCYINRALKDAEDFQSTGQHLLSDIRRRDAAFYQRILEQREQRPTASLEREER